MPRIDARRLTFEEIGAKTGGAQQELVQELHLIIEQDWRTIKKICYHAKVSPRWVETLRRNPAANPSIKKLDQVLRVLGYKLTITKL